MAAGLNNQVLKLCCAKGSFVCVLYQAPKPLAQFNVHHAFKEKVTSAIAPTAELIEHQHVLAAIFPFVQHDDSVMKLDALIAQLVALHHIDAAPKAFKHYQLNSLKVLCHAPCNKAFAAEITATFQALATHSSHIGLCHHDLVPENILCQAGTPYLIDFEYAAFSDVFFDLASISVGFSLTQAGLVPFNGDDTKRGELREAILSGYFSQAKITYPKVKALEKLTLFERVYVWVCAAWYEEHGETERAMLMMKRLP